MKRLSYLQVFAIFLATVGVVVTASVFFFTKSVDSLYQDFGLDIEATQIPFWRLIAYIIGVGYVVFSVVLWRKPNWADRLLEFRISAISEILLWLGATVPALLAVYLATYQQINTLKDFVL